MTRCAPAPPGRGPPGQDPLDLGALGRPAREGVVPSPLPEAAWYGGRDQTRVVVKIAADKISGAG